MDERAEYNGHCGPQSNCASTSSRQSTREKASNVIQELTRNPQAIEFLELRIYDIHGYAKGRLLSTSAEIDVFNKGTGLAPALTCMGVKGQVNQHSDLWEGVGHTNARMVPIMTTVKPCLKAVRGDRNIASVLCEMRLDDGTLDPRCPRQAALAQLERLKSEFGYDFKSTFEAEFGITDSKSREPLGDHYCCWTSLVVMELAQEELVDLTDAMEDIGIKLDTLQLEYGVGQVEATFAPVMGIEAADMVADFKTASFVHLRKKGFNAEFMTCIQPTVGCSNGFHFNFSVWNKQGQNVFVDPGDPKKLSTFGRHWLAGLVEHSPAMLALCSPTVNCYRRIGNPFAPTFANWAQENRMASFRLKIEAEGNVYIENRLPSSACNPYLVLASTLAAGIDGVRRKLDLPQAMDESSRLPATLEEALDALVADTRLQAALGESINEMFVYVKRTFEVEEFKAFKELSDEERLNKEKEYYYQPY